MGFEEIFFFVVTIILKQKAILGLYFGQKGRSAVTVTVT